MAQKIVTLYIDDTSLRLLVTHGKRIKKWADSPLEPGSVRNAVVLKEAEVADKVKLLFQALKLRTKKVIVGISGLHCLTRPITLPQLPKEMLDEAVRREAKNLLPVPLEQLYLSWQTIPAPIGKTQVFLVAIPCKAADSLIKTLALAGVKPYLMDLKPLALARAVREVNAVIVDAQPTEFDIVITVGGIPQPIRTVPFPNEALPWSKKLPMIKKDLDRTIEFYNTNNPEKPLLATVPVFVSGELASETELHQSLANEMGRPVLPMPPPLDCPRAGLNPNHYLVNMGLTLKELPSENEAKPLAINLNALPDPYRSKPVSLTNIITLPSAAIATGLVLLMFMLIQIASADIASMQGKLNTTDQLLQQKLAHKQELNGNIAKLQKNIAEAEATGSNFAAVLNGLETRSHRANGIEVAVDNLPGTIHLTNLSYTGDTLTINGQAPSEEEVLSYLRDLDATELFPEITITSLSRTKNEEEMNFTLFLRVGDSERGGAS